MHHQHPVEKSVGKCQGMFLDQGAQASIARPCGDAEMGGHRRHAAFRLQEKGAQERHGITVTQEAKAFDIGPNLAQAAQQDAPGHRPQMAVIEIGELADIELHGS